MTTDTQPKSSALFNNCLLHSITPEIKAEILKFANPLYNNKHNEAYDLLKDIFAEFYQLDNASFDWRMFAAILDRYNPFDTQIMLGPVLRIYATKMMTCELQVAKIPDDTMFGAEAIAEYYNSPGLFNKIPDTDTNAIQERFIFLQQTIDDHSGRYSSLGPPLIFNYLCKPLGLGLIWVKDNTTNQLGDEQTHLGSISIFHQGNINGANQGGHWERHDDPAMIEDYEKYGSTQFEFFLSFFQDNQNLRTHQSAFALIKQHIQLTQKSIIENKELIDKFMELNCTALQIEYFLFNTKIVSQKIAVSLLGEPLTNETKNFIKNYTVPPIYQSGEKYEQYIDAVKTNSKYLPHLKEQDMTIANRLLTVPPHMPHKSSWMVNFLKALMLFSRPYILSAHKDTTTTPQSERLAQQRAAEQRLVKQRADEKLAQQKAEKLAQQKKQEEQLAKQKEADKLAQQKKQEEQLAKQQEADKLAQQKQQEELAKQETEKQLLAQYPFKQEFDTQIKILENKKEEFKDLVEYKDLYMKFDELCTNLKNEGDAYFNKVPTEETYKAFVANTNKLIEDARPAIDQHRNFTKIVLVNIAAFICTAALGYLIAAGVNMAMHHGKFTFFNTQRADRVDELQDIIQRTEPKL